MPVSSYTNSTDPKGHYSQLNESFSKPRCISVKALDNDFRLFYERFNIIPPLFICLRLEIIE